MIPGGRGNDGSNVLRLQTCFTAKSREWRARDLPPKRAGRRFSRQSLGDNKATLELLYATCPDVDLIEMTVREPEHERLGVLMIGSVNHKGFQSCYPLSTAMRVKLVPVNYLIVDGRIQLLTAPRMCRAIVTEIRTARPKRMKDSLIILIEGL